MNEYAVIYWISFFVLFLAHFLLISLNAKKINILSYGIIFVGSCIFYSLVDYIAVVYGPNIIGTYASQSVIGVSSGWVISENLKNVFRLSNYKLLTSIFLIFGWHNYVF